MISFPSYLCRGTGLGQSCFFFPSLTLSQSPNFPFGKNPILHILTQIHTLHIWFDIWHPNSDSFTHKGLGHEQFLTIPICLSALQFFLLFVCMIMCAERGSTESIYHVIIILNVYFHKISTNSPFSIFPMPYLGAICLCVCEWKQFTPGGTSCPPHVFQASPQAYLKNRSQETCSFSVIVAHTLAHSRKRKIRGRRARTHTTVPTSYLPLLPGAFTFYHRKSESGKPYDFLDSSLGLW